MLKRVKEYFKGEVTSLQVDNSGQASEQELLIAVGVLLLEIAGMDEDYAPEETKIIFRTMQSQFNVSQEQALDLLEIADSVRQESGGSIDGFIDQINQHYSPSQRQTILAMIWRVVFADGEIDKFETRFAQQMKYRLQLSDQQAEEARNMAQTGQV